MTKGKQWIRLNKSLELLDTPGILWPKFEDQTVGERLALIGSMNDEILNREEMCMSLIGFLQEHYPKVLEERYQTGQEACSALSVLEAVCQSRQCLKKGGDPDYARGAALLLDDFRSGRLGRLTLERPQEGKQA